MFSYFIVCFFNGIFRTFIFQFLWLQYRNTIDILNGDFVIYDPASGSSRFVSLYYLSLTFKVLTVSLILKYFPPVPLKIPC